jgi:hypothetical protein
MPESQDLERQIRRVWDVYAAHPAAHVNSTILLSRLDEIAADARKLDLPYTDWLVLYRQLLQLGRALKGEEQLIEKIDRQLQEARQAPDGVLAKAVWLARRAVDL